MIIIILFYILKKWFSKKATKFFFKEATVISFLSFDCIAFCLGLFKLKGTTSIGSIVLIGEHTVTVVWFENGEKRSKPVAKSSILQHYPVKSMVSNRPSLKYMLFCACFTVVFVSFLSAVCWKYKQELEVCFIFILVEYLKLKIIYYKNKRNKMLASIMR